MGDRLRPCQDALIAALADAIRGPQRNGVFALWLILRACDGLLPPHPLSARAHRRRLEGLVRRLTSLSLPPVLRRLLMGCVRELQQGTAAAALAVLRQLADSVSEPLGPAARTAMARAAELAAGVVEVDSAAPLAGVAR